MRALLLAILVVLPAPLAIASDVHARNVTFFSALLGDPDADAIATLPDGRAVTLAAALDAAAARAGSVDLGALARGATPSDGPSRAVGDVWVIETGDGPCVETLVAEQPVRLEVIYQQLTIYRGHVGTQSTSDGDPTMFIAWTYGAAFPPAVTEIRDDTAGFTAYGNSDMYCLTLGDRHLAFPFLDGYANWN